MVLVEMQIHINLEQLFKVFNDFQCKFISFQ